MNEFFAGLSGFFADWGWLFLLIIGIFASLAIIWYVIIALFIGKIFRGTGSFGRRNRL